jgi:cardiolipin synthase
VTTLLYVAGAIVLAALLDFAYVTIAVNFVASHQDRVDHVPAVADDPARFMRALHGAAGEAVTTGNDVVVYQNGDAIFPPMLEAIAGSRSTVHFSSYIFWSGSIAERFIEAFCAAARRGVVVRLVVDSEGSSDRLHRDDVRRLRDAGCRFAWYRRVQWFDFTKYNHRSHRRILVVDGAVAFTGGAGVADQWLGNAEDATQWRETHARIAGPAVQGLQAGFTDSWNRCTSELLLHERDYPALAPAGRMQVTTVVSTPSAGTSPAQRVVAACIGAATTSLRVTNAYFVPTPAFVEALCAARARGVAVTVVVPGPLIDQRFVRRASRHTWHQLVAGGVELHEFQPAMVHAKTMVVDDVVALIGSINFDPRSFSLNAECGIVAADRGLAAVMAGAFTHDLTRSTRVTPEALARLQFVTRAVDALCYWCRPQL